VTASSRHCFRRAHMATVIDVQTGRRRSKGHGPALVSAKVGSSPRRRCALDRDFLCESRGGSTYHHPAFRIALIHGNPVFETLACDPPDA